MGKSNGNSWLNVVRNAFKSPTKVDREENDQEVDNKRGKRRWVFLKNCPQETTIQHNVCKARTEGNLVAKHARVESSVLEQRCAVAMASTAAAEAAVATARAAVDILSLNTFASPQFVNLHRAALVIQTMFRGYLARRALMALKGIVKLQALIRAHIVRKRAKMTLQCIQSLVRVQAHVCDQRRRRSCEATSLGSLFTANYRRKSLSKNVSSSSDYHPRAVEEIQALVQKARECSFKQGKKTLGHVLSQQIWKADEDQFSDNSYPEFEGGKRYKNRNLNNLVSVDSPKTPSSTKTDRRNYQSAETPTLRSIYHHRMSMSESSYPLPRPHYMAATASAMARVRPHSTPRHRPSSPNREQTGCSSAKKRLSFPIPDPNPHNADDKANNRRIYSAKKHHDVPRLDVPCYLTE